MNSKQLCEPQAAKKIKDFQHQNFKQTPFCKIKTKTTSVVQCGLASRISEKDINLREGENCGNLISKLVQ